MCHSFNKVGSEKLPYIHCYIPLFKVMVDVLHLQATRRTRKIPVCDVFYCGLCNLPPEDGIRSQFTKRHIFLIYLQWRTSAIICQSLLCYRVGCNMTSNGPLYKAQLIRDRSKGNPRSPAVTQSGLTAVILICWFDFKD